MLAFLTEEVFLLDLHCKITQLDQSLQREIKSGLYRKWFNIRLSHNLLWAVGYGMSLTLWETFVPKMCTTCMKVNPLYILWKFQLFQTIFCFLLDQEGWLPVDDNMPLMAYSPWIPWGWADRLWQKSFNWQIEFNYSSHCSTSYPSSSLSVRLVM